MKYSMLVPIAFFTGKNTTSSLIRFHESQLNGEKDIGNLKVSLTSCASSVAPMLTDRFRLVSLVSLNEYPKRNSPISKLDPETDSPSTSVSNTCLCEYPMLKDDRSLMLNPNPKLAPIESPGSIVPTSSSVSRV